MKKITIKSYEWVTIIFAVTGLVLHLVTNTNYELHRDELLYFNMADHLSFGYATVPPMTAFLAFVSKAVFGYSVAGLRLLPALAGAMTMLVISRIVRIMGGGVPALTIASLCFLLSPGFLLINSLFTPNAFELLLWTLIMWILLRIITGEDSRLWILAGIVTGISFMFKYSVLFLLAGFTAAFVPGRYIRLLRSRYFLISVLAGILIILPNILWQCRHSLPVITHMSELNRTQLQDNTPGIFLTDLFSLTLASTPVWLLGLVSLIFFKHNRAIRFFGISSTISIVLFLVLKGKGYYVLGLLPFLLAAGGCAMEKYMTRGLVPLRNSIMALVVVISVLALPTGLPILDLETYMKYREKTGFLKIYPFYRWEGGEVHNLSQVYADMTGWEELAGYTAVAYYMLSPEEREVCTIFCEKNYGYAGAVHFYGRQHGLPDAVTFHESYSLWAPDTIGNGPVIYLSPGVNDIEQLFGEVTQVGYVRNPYFRESGVKVFLCREPSPSVQELYREIAEDAREDFR